jgi:hypothetical protein
MASRRSLDRSVKHKASRANHGVENPKKKRRKKRMRSKKAKRNDTEAGRSSVKKRANRASNYSSVASKGTF